jgi:hypothetical protein
MSPPKNKKKLKNPLPDNDFRKALVRIFKNHKKVSKDYSVLFTGRLRQKIRKMSVGTPTAGVTKTLRFPAHGGHAAMQVELKRVPFVESGGACECIEYCEPDFECCTLLC